MSNPAIHNLMLNAEKVYFTPAMKFAKAALSAEWQTASQLSSKWTTLDALVARGLAESRTNPEMQTGVDALQWRLKTKGEEK